MNFKKLAAIGIAFALTGGVAQAQQQTRLNETGSLLVYPLVDTLTSANETIINITNTGPQGVWVECFTESHGAMSTSLVKEDFTIFLTPFQKVWWRVSQGYEPTNLTNQFGFPAYSIPPQPGAKGFLYCFAIEAVTGTPNPPTNQDEVTYNFLKGDALIFGDGKAFQYNAIPHQRLDGASDRVLNLDGQEYTRGSSRIWFEGLPEEIVLNGGDINGTLVLSSIQADFFQSIQTHFDVNYTCWNRKEQKFSRHRGSYLSFIQQDLTLDVKMNMFNIRADAFSCRADTTLSTGGQTDNTGFEQFGAQFAPGNRTPIWAVFHQSAGDGLAWGSNVWHDPNWGADAVVRLP